MVQPDELPQETEEPLKKDSRVGKSGSQNRISDEVVSKLQGKTLIVYMTLLNVESTGVRELQRQLNLSSPSLARYHLDKLVDLDLVQNINGIYKIKGKADIPALSSWIYFGRYLIPRQLIGAILFSLLFFGYLIFFYRYWNRDSAFLIFFGCCICSYMWYEFIWHYKRRPF